MRNISDMLFKSGVYRLTKNPWYERFTNFLEKYSWVALKGSINCLHCTKTSVTYMSLQIHEIWTLKFIIEQIGKPCAKFNYQNVNHIVNITMQNGLDYKYGQIVESRALLRLWHGTWVHVYPFTSCEIVALRKKNVDKPDSYDSNRAKRLCTLCAQKCADSSTFTPHPHFLTQSAQKYLSFKGNHSRFYRLNFRSSSVIRAI
jgi:hypothetical protein